jgi:hypothetical protein
MKPIVLYRGKPKECGLHQYKISFYEKNELGGYDENTHIEFAYTAEDALTQFLTNCDVTKNAIQNIQTIDDDNLVGNP